MVSRSSILRSSQAGVLFLFPVILGGCATTDAAGTTTQASGSKATTAVPPNYRQLVARHMAANTDRSKLLKAEISRPGEGWTGLMGGGNRPIVCASVTIQGSLIQQSYTLGFTFENGQIADVFSSGGYNPMIGAVGVALQEALTCGKLSYAPFPELAKASK